jgi:hypothetical protein
MPSPFAACARVKQHLIKDVLFSGPKDSRPRSIARAEIPVVSICTIPHILLSTCTGVGVSRSLVLLFSPDKRTRGKRNTYSCARMDSRTDSGSPAPADDCERNKMVAGKNSKQKKNRKRKRKTETSIFMHMLLARRCVSPPREEGYDQIPVPGRCPVRHEKMKTPGAQPNGVFSFQQHGSERDPVKPLHSRSGGSITGQTRTELPQGRRQARKLFSYAVVNFLYSWYKFNLARLVHALCCRLKVYPSQVVIMGVVVTAKTLVQENFVTIRSFV